MTAAVCLHQVLEGLTQVRSKDSNPLPPAAQSGRPPFSEAPDSSIYCVLDPAMVAATSPRAPCLPALSHLRGGCFRCTVRTRRGWPSTLIPAGVHRPVRFTDKERLKALRTPKHTVGLLLSDFRGHCISCLPPPLLTWVEGGGVCPAHHGLGLPGLSPGCPPHSFTFLVSALPGVLCGASAVTLQASQRQQPGLGPWAHPAPW